MGAAMGASARPDSRVCDIVNAVVIVLAIEESVKTHSVSLVSDVHQTLLFVGQFAVQVLLHSFGVALIIKVHIVG